VKVMVSNPGYLLKSFLLYKRIIRIFINAWHAHESYSISWSFMLEYHPSSCGNERRTNMPQRSPVSA
jgi:hypothetical protein